MQQYNCTFDDMGNIEIMTTGNNMNILHLYTPNPNIST